MRVIGGLYKRRRFDIPHSFKARPTTDFAKESLFNILTNYIDFDTAPTALDLFAGTGSIGLELLSRGCSKVISVEKEPAHHAFILKIMKEIKTDHWYPVRGDVFKYLAGTRGQFDIIFADPPYDFPLLPTIPDVIDKKKLLKSGGLLILEHGKDHTFETHPQFLEMRKYGSVHFSFFRALTQE